MTPDPRSHLQALADALPADAMATVPVSWLRAVLAGSGEASALPPADLTCKQLAERWGLKAASTIRNMCHAGKIPGAYLFRGREYRIPLARVAAYEEREREGRTSDVEGSDGVADLGAWRRAAK